MTTKTVNGVALPASSFLIATNPDDVSTWHLPVKDADGKPDHGHMGAAWAALHSDFRGQGYDGPGKADAITALTALYASEKVPTPDAEESKDAPFDEIEVKAFAFEPDVDADLQPGEFAGYVAVTKNVDRAGDVILPGAFENAIPDFLANGAIYLNHDWQQGGEPIGKPLEAREDAKGLYLKGRISETTKGRDTLTLLRDGVIKSMSVGYRPKGARYLTHAEGKKLLGEGTYTKALETLPTNRARVRALAEFKSLFDGSLVTIPCNPEAVVLGVKSGAPAALPFDDHVSAVRDANAEMCERFRDLAHLRAAAGRTLSETKRAQLADLRGSVAGQLAEIDAVIASLPLTESETKASEEAAEATRTTLARAARREYARFLEMEARASGNL